VNPWLAVFAVVAAFAALMLIAGGMRSRGRVSAEICRKSLHVGMGAVTVIFPWVFSENWPVLVLTGGFVALLLALRFVPVLRERYGAILCGVGRTSWGEIYFPIAVGVLFVLTRDRPIFYAIAILILTLADAAAALIGASFGRHRYLADEGEKSWEGSAAFWVVAFACTFCPLFGVGWEPLHAALVALCVASVTMLLEATAWRGLDNLFVPLATLAMLLLYQNAPDAVLLRHLGGLAMVAGLHLLCRKFVLLREGTLLGAFVVIYLCWTLGGVLWAVAPIVVLTIHPLLALGAPAGKQILLHAHQALLAFGLPSLAWLFADRLLQLPGFAPFNIAFAAHLALTAVSLWRTADRRAGWLLVLAAAIFGWALAVLPWWLIGQIPLTPTMLAAALITLVAATFHALQRTLDEKPFRHWATRAALAGLASLAGV
jgi:phytol kinase